MNNLFRFFLFAVCTLFLISCSTIKLDSIALPPESQQVESTINLGRNFVEADKRIREYLLLSKYKNFDSKIRKLDINTDTNQIFEFYKKELQEKDFAEDQENLKIKFADIHVWKKENLLNEQIIIVSIVESRNANTDELTGKSLTIYSAQK